jgi:hypothetical protein
MMSGSLRRCGLALVALLAAACDDGPRDLYFGIGAGTVQAVVTGRVVDPAAVPVPGAGVATRLFGDPACLSANPGDLAPTTTSSDGRFTVRVDIPFSDPFEGCVHIGVTPPDGAGFLPDSAEAPVDLRVQPPYDSIYVEIRLIAAPAVAR